MERSDFLNKVKEFLGFRKQSYQHVFNPEGKYSREVLEDLAKFCRANESTFHVDPRTQALLEGRREVFLRIQHHIRLTDEELWKLYGKK